MMVGNGYGLVITFKERNCLMRLDMKNLNLEDFAGQCDSTGLHLSGHRLTELKMILPVGTDFDGDSKVFIGMQRSGENIITISMKTDMVLDTIAVANPPRKIGYDIITNTIYMTVSHGFGKVDLESHDFTLLAGSTMSRSASSGVPMCIDEIAFFEPSGFLRVGTYRWMVADTRNHR